MKKYIITLMFLAFTVPAIIVKAQENDPDNVAGFVQEQADNMVIITSNPKIPKILSTNVLSLEQSSGSTIDLNNSMIFWEIDGKWSESGLGLTKYNLKIGAYTNQIRIRARIQYTNDSGKKTYYDATANIKPGVETPGKGDPNEKLVPMVDSKDLYIKSIPASPRSFQRVEFQAIPKKGNNCNIAEETFEWLVDGKTAQEGVGLDRFTIRMVGPGGITPVSVNAHGCGVAEINLIPRSDPRYYLQQNTATQFLNCESQYVLMLNSSVNSIGREIDKFLETSDKAIDNIGKDIDFIKETIEDLDKDWEATKDMFTSVKDAFSNPTLKNIASGLKSLSNLVLRNPFSQRIEYIRSQIEYYTKLINWYNNYQYRLQSQLDSIRRRAKTQQDRCLEITKQKFDLNLRSTGEINDFKKYDW